MDDKYSESELHEAHHRAKNPTISTTSLGIWKILTLRKTSYFEATRWIEWDKYISAIPDARQFLLDIYSLDPLLVVLFLFSRAWRGIEPGITVYISAQLFITIEVFLRDGHGDTKTILQAVVAHILCVVVTTLLNCGENWLVPKLTSQTIMLFEEKLMRENMRYDVQTLQYKKGSRNNAYMAWHSFSHLIETCSGMLGLFTIMTSIFVQRNGGPLFTVLCLIYPLVTRVGSSSRSNAMVVYSDHKEYLRLQALHLLTDPDYREDIVTSNLSAYIMKEYADARKALGTAAVDDPTTQYRYNVTPSFQVFQNLCAQLPVIYFAFSAILNPASLTLSALAILRQQSGVLQHNVQSTFAMLAGLLWTLETIKSLYTAEELRLVDGATEYRPPEGSKGMAFELRNVSFAYPVGANGSGKSTFIKLLTRMYDATSGEILVDGRPIQGYKVADLHEATAMLTQNHHIYPFSLAENIGVGHSDRVEDYEMVMESAKKGGAHDLIAGLQDGLATILEPVKTAYANCDVERDEHKALKDVLDSLEVTTQVSGGERQRVAASRTFMRLSSPKIKFVAVDEPSSALDPRGELELFDRLREERVGKTMIFVTHRFGHLTRFADLIICMKNGQIVESGCHKDLLALNGEYATLYNIQAQAFTSKPVATEELDLDTPPTTDV
ncbi:Lipid A export ATP-binding/permease protein MsbA [Hypsizygus marmoreus]|uniref:Lipid A export ATP-binding/permease protein MsbA n=1 Tax=Hypsizygus marmoreus TaxID=39966 RepID=A0A369J7L8_HYPMA|nr:Lipid A export ATP-binding/permease protein MsbA [Hypsizygus marmoreus]